MLQPPGMSLSDRRNTRPPPLSLPSGAGGLTVHVEGEELKTPVRTPMPITPLPLTDDSAMTPDTAEFPKTGWPTTAWTEDEDGLIETYLAKPPRAVSQQYPPGELPPPAVIVEIARQLVQYERPKSGWTRSFEETKARVFHVARQESMRKVGGYHRRTPSDPRHKSPEEDRPELVPEFNLTQVIEDVEQEMVIPGFTQSLRLSDDQHSSDRTTRPPLSSPLEMQFNIPKVEPPKIEQPKRVPITSSHSFPAPLRPASLLQRGRSFTSQDLLDEAQESHTPRGKSQHTTVRPDVEMAGHDADDESDMSASSHRMSAGEMRSKSVSSPVSNITNSPPSSMSSYSIIDDVDVEGYEGAGERQEAAVAEPDTPLEQMTFDLDLDVSTTPTGRTAAPAAAPHTAPFEPTLSAPQTPHAAPLVPALEPQSAPQLARKTSNRNRTEGAGPTPEELADRDHKRQRVTNAREPTLSHDSTFGPAL